MTRPLIALCGLLLLLTATAVAQGAQTNCAVNASVGYVNCLSYVAPSSEQTKAWHSTGLPYRFQLHRPADGAIWGYWQWNDLDYHVVFLNLSGTITGQIDNRGSANPASYFVELAG